MKNIFPILVTGTVIVFFGFFVYNQWAKNGTTNQLSGAKKEITVSETVAVAKPTIKSETKAIVPLPQEEDIIRSFFNLIDEHRPSDAVSMMIPSIVEDESKKQSWAVYFNAFKSVKVKSIKPSNQSDWTADKHMYQVILEVEIKPEAASTAPMPNYGWEKGDNIRWVGITKVGSLWKIEGIATGP